MLNLLFRFSNVFNRNRKKTKQVYFVSPKASRNMRAVKKRECTVSDKAGGKGTSLTGFDIIFAFVKIKEHVVTHE